MFLVGLASEPAYNKSFLVFKDVLWNSKSPFLNSIGGTYLDAWDVSCSFDEDKLEV